MRTSYPFLARALCAACCFFLLLHCTGRQAVFLEKIPAPVAEADTAALNAEAEARWSKREDRQTAYDALYAYQRAFAAAPGDPRLGAKLAQAFVFVGDYCAQTDEERDTLYHRGLETSERTLALCEPFRMHMIRTQDEEEALDKVVRQINFDKRNRQEERSRHWLAAIYWLSVNLERWTDSQNTLRRMGNKKRIEIYKRAVLQADETFDYGGVYRSSRVVPMKPPYAGARSLREGFERALAIAPDYFANRRAYAQLYALPENKADLFREQLEYVINNDPNKLPGAFAENKYEQALALTLRDEAAADFAELQRKAAEKEKKKREFKPRY
jgi:hypothetical protein